MNILMLLLFLLWLACCYLVVRFVLRTGGTTKIGHVAHWFGGTFTIIGLAVGLTVIFAQVDANFGTRANVYVFTHQPKRNEAPLLQRHIRDDLVTIYRRGSINTTARLDGDQLLIDEDQTIGISLWWMLWDKKFTTSHL